MLLLVDCLRTGRSRVHDQSDGGTPTRWGHFVIMRNPIDNQHETVDI